MGVNTAHVLGRDRKFFAATEVTPGTFVKPTGAAAVKVESAMLGVSIDRKNLMTSRQTRSLLERVTGRASYPWSADLLLRPSGTAGTPPDAHALIKAVLGGYTNTPATSDAYTLSDAQTFDTVSIAEHFPSGDFMQSLAGATAETLTIAVTGGSEPTMKVDGVAMSHVQTGPSTLNGAMAASTTMVVQTADGWHYEGSATHGSVVTIGSTTNVGVVLDTSRPSFTVDTAVTEDNASTVIPYTPDETVAGSPANGITGSFKIDTVAHPIVQFEITHKNNRKPLDEALTQTHSDLIDGPREVTGTISIRGRRDHLVLYANRKGFGTVALLVTIGDTAGSMVEIAVPYAEFNFADLEVPEGEEVVMSLPFVALGSAGADEWSLTFK